MIRILVGLFAFWACRCPPGDFAAFGAPASGVLVCLTVPPRGCEDVGPPACPRPTAHVGLVLCRDLERPMLDADGRGLHCESRD